MKYGIITALGYFKSDLNMTVIIFPVITVLIGIGYRKNSSIIRDWVLELKDRLRFTSYMITMM